MYQDSNLSIFTAVMVTRWQWSPDEIHNTIVLRMYPPKMKAICRKPLRLCIQGMNKQVLLWCGSILTRAFCRMTRVGASDTKSYLSIPSLDWKPVELITHTTTEIVKLTSLYGLKL